MRHKSRNSTIIIIIIIIPHPSSPAWGPPTLLYNGHRVS